MEYKNIMELFIIKYPKEQTLCESKIRSHKCTFIHVTVINNKPGRSYGFIYPYKLSAKEI
jgi:hypothetical protein